jgi:hypothetical protein
MTVKNTIVGRPRQRQYQGRSCRRPARNACHTAIASGTKIQGRIQTAWPAALASALPA